MPNLRAAASSTRTPSGITSLPMPSPAMTAIFFLLMEDSFNKPKKMVRGGGLEPPQYYYRQDLNLVRLPISPPAQKTKGAVCQTTPIKSVDGLFYPGLQAKSAHHATHH